MVEQSVEVRLGAVDFPLERLTHRLFEELRYDGAMKALDEAIDARLADLDLVMFDVFEGAVELGGLTVRRAAK